MLAVVAQVVENFRQPLALVVGQPLQQRLAQVQGAALGMGAAADLPLVQQRPPQQHKGKIDVLRGPVRQHMAAGGNTLHLHLADFISVPADSPDPTDDAAGPGDEGAKPAQQTAAGHIQRHPGTPSHHGADGCRGRHQGIFPQPPQVPLLDIEQVRLCQRQGRLGPGQVAVVVQLLHPLAALALALDEMGLVALEQQLLHRFQWQPLGY